MHLQGKAAIVTGASRGIGRAIAERLASLGASVVINYAANRDKAEEAVESIVKRGGRAIAVQADVSRVGDVEKLFADAVSELGKVDILVNNAGVIDYRLIGDVTEADFDRLFAINVKGTYFACQQAMKRMEEGGRIVNFSTSVVGSMLPAYSVYAATKGAVEQMTRQLAKEFGPKRITINAIAPGPVRTELFMTGKTQEQIDATSQANAFRRLGEPEDIANAVELLVSDRSGWITGQTIRANGGSN
ncbi:SDR family oxidoreductase [Paenibacillus flagellatus]|uniref:3-ketoacyl-ACP reductase n=1 Tax=Paenibacillus flagellatus TaxID=2211139 RepID=A0A2V5JVL4_9BACL|nr:SDR family oxidoreductase [Paenibacillus flagellatus]PYI50775.1 3-ketoacyl-ACP reductase [Paenibacillus flagellatus]